MSNTVDKFHDWAKKILYRNLSVEEGFDAILKECHRRHKEAYWDQCRKLPLQEDVEHIRAYLRKALTHSDRPSKDVCVLWLGLHDCADRFNLRGSSEWSNDPDDWEWCGSDDYEFDENDDGGCMAGCGSQILEAWSDEFYDYIQGRYKKVPDGLYKLASSFASLTYAGLVAQNVFKTEPAELVLGGRKERWFAVGHPDSEYGIILGCRTAKGWVPFNEK
jgi:hypothetical protein